MNMVHVLRIYEDSIRLFDVIMLFLILIIMFSAYFFLFACPCWTFGRSLSEVMSGVYYGRFFGSTLC